MLKSLLNRSCPECSQQRVSTGKLSMKMVRCSNCHSCFSLNLGARIGSAALYVISIPMIIILTPTLGIFASIVFCFIIAIVIEYLIFRYCPLKKRAKKEIYR